MMRAAGLMILLAGTVLPLGALEIRLDDPRLEYSGFVSKTFVEGPRRNQRMTFSRRIPHRNHLEHDNPGGRIRLKTDSRSIRVKVRYNGLHHPDVPLESTGIFLIDGEFKPENTFTVDNRKRTRYFRKDLSFRIPADGAMHEYEVILPSGDSVELLGISVSDRAKFGNVKPFEKRIVLYGDSIAQGGVLQAVQNSFSYLLGRAGNWDVVNVAMADTLLTPWHAEFLAPLKTDLLLVMTGTHDWKSGTPVAVFKKNLERFVQIFRKKQPDTPIVLVTPLKDGSSTAPYRKAMQSFGKEHSIRVIDGTALLPSDSFFSRDRILPNEAGAAELARKLSKLLFPDGRAGNDK